jgi:uncharacterized protein YkwD
MQTRKPIVMIIWWLQSTNHMCNMSNASWNHLHFGASYNSDLERIIYMHACLGLFSIKQMI